jgi:putative ABC transport system substrate-binding protein
VRRIGYLYANTSVTEQPFEAAFLDRLHQLGWIDGENLIREKRSAEGQAELLPELAASLLQVPLEVIYCVGDAAALAVHQLTTTTSIVAGVVTDATASELMKNLARPAGNVTGTTIGSTTLMIKSVELLRTVLPLVSRLAIMVDKGYPSYSEVPPALQTAQTLGIQVQELDVRTVEDVDGALGKALAWGADALVVQHISPFTAGVSARVSKLAAQKRLAVMFQTARPVTDLGELMSFTWDQVAVVRQNAEYVDKLLRGAKPADLPVEEPRQFDFIVNIEAAQTLGLTFPPDAAAQVTQWVQ